MTRLAGVCVSLAVIGAVVSCDSTPSVPETLVDESPARQPPVALEDVGTRAILTRMRLVRGDALVRGSALVAACIGRRRDSVPRVIVERVGAVGSSVTGLAAGGRVARGCDSVGGWCGHAFGRIDAGRLRDPRLSLTCRDAAGASVGFLWVEPRPDATYLVVEHPAYAEVYPTSGVTPVRVTVTEVDLERSTAEARIAEYAQDGRRLRTYVVEAQVAG